MPKMFVHAPQGTFTAEARSRIAAALTELGIACERLKDSAQVRAGVWVYFVEHGPDTVFRGGHAAAQPIISLKVFALKGGLDLASKTRLIAEATAILGEHCGITDGEVPAYVGILEVPEENWGMYGKPVNLSALQAKD